MTTTNSRKMMVVIFDLRQCLPNDYRFMSTIEVLQNVTTLRQAMTRSSWSHFSLMAIKEGSNKVTTLQSLEAWQNITNISLIHAFNQLKTLVNNENGDVKSASLNSALLNINREYKGLKKDEADLFVTTITLRWEGYVRKEIRDFCLSGMDSISHLEMVEITGYENKFIFSDRIHVRSLPVKGLDIAAEAVFKTWLKDIPSRLVIILRCDTKEIEIETHAECVMMEPKKNGNTVFGKGSTFPTELTILSFMPKQSLCQTMLYGHSLLSTRKGTQLDNCYCFTALARFMMDKGLIAVAQDVNVSSFRQKLVLIAGSEEKILVQHIVTDEMANTTFEVQMSDTTVSSESTVDEITSKLPIKLEYGMGCPVNIIDYLRSSNNKVATSGPIELPAVRNRACPTEYAHPALAMY